MVTRAPCTSLAYVPDKSSATVRPRRCVPDLDGGEVVDVMSWRTKSCSGNVKLRSNDTQHKESDAHQAPFPCNKMIAELASNRQSDMVTRVTWYHLLAGVVCVRLDQPPLCDLVVERFDVCFDVLFLRDVHYRYRS